jgi:DNA-directed RNA polymerase I, II, and III subunit RPABC1
MENALIVINQMLTQRGYIIQDSTEEDRIIALKPCGNKIITFFTNTPKFNVKNIQIYIAVMNEMEIYHSIIVYKDGITAFTKKAIDQSTELKFELFSQEDLQYNITKHYLQPIFILMPKEEIESFKANYGTKFPIMKKDDPIARFYDYQKGDIVRVIRSSIYGQGESITYRIVK